MSSPLILCQTVLCILAPPAIYNQQSILDTQPSTISSSPLLSFLLTKQSDVNPETLNSEYTGEGNNLMNTINTLDLNDYKQSDINKNNLIKPTLNEEIQLIYNDKKNVTSDYVNINNTSTNNNNFWSSTFFNRLVSANDFVKFSQKTPTSFNNTFPVVQIYPPLLNGVLMQYNMSDQYPKWQETLEEKLNNSAPLRAQFLAYFTPGKNGTNQIKIWGGGTESKFPPAIEGFVQRIQTYFSVYNDFEDLSRPSTATTTAATTTTNSKRLIIGSELIIYTPDDLDDEDSTDDSLLAETTQDDESSLYEITTANDSITTDIEIELNDTTYKME